MNQRAAAAGGLSFAEKLDSRMKTFCLLSALLVTAVLNAPAQIKTSPDDSPAKAAMATDPWEFGAFLQGGVGTGDRSDFSFLSAGGRAGKVLTDEHLPGILRGQLDRKSVV